MKISLTKLEIKLFARNRRNREREKEIEIVSFRFICGFLACFVSNWRNFSIVLLLWNSMMMMIEKDCTILA